MKQRQPNNSIDANTLVTAIVEAQRASLTAMFATLGIAQITTHPSSVPTNDMISAQAIMANQPAAFHVPQAAQGMPPIPAQVPPMPAQPLQTAPIVNAPPSQGKQRKGKGTGNGHVKSLAPPTFGDFHCQVGANRTKLPLGIFRDESGEQRFKNIHLRLPDGTYHTLNTDGEGRGRLTVSTTDKIGAFENQDHMLVFTRDIEYANVWDVAIVRGIRESTGAAAHAASVPTQPAQLQTAPITAKKPRSAAQLANDKRLSETKKNSTTQAASVPTQANYPQQLVRVVDEPLQQMQRITDDFDSAFESRPIPPKGFDYVRPLPQRAR